MNYRTRLNPIWGLAIAASVLFPIAALRAEEPAKLILEKKDAKKTVEVHTGNAFAVRLSAQLGTGYSWKVALQDGKVVTQDGEPKTEPAADTKGTPKVGAAENQVFRFTAKSPGEVHLKFDYARGFEPGKKPLHTVSFHIKVVDAKK